MQTISGAGNWKLIVRREAGHIAILRAGTCDRRAVLPDGKIAVRHPAPTEEDSRLPNVW